jgi:hypothetical protein
MSKNHNTKILILKIAEKFLEDIKNNPPYVDHTLSLYVALSVMDLKGEQLIAEEMLSQSLRDALSDWWPRQNEDNFKQVAEAVKNIFNSMFEIEGEIGFNGKIFLLTESIDFTTSNFSFFAGDYTDPADPITESGATYYFDGRSN